MTSVPVTIDNALQNDINDVFGSAFAIFFRIVQIELVIFSYLRPTWFPGLNSASQPELSYQLEECVDITTLDHISAKKIPGKHCDACHQVFSPNTRFLIPHNSFTSYSRDSSSHCEHNVLLISSSSSMCITSVHRSLPSSSPPVRALFSLVRSCLTTVVRLFRLSRVQLSLVSSSLCCCSCVQTSLSFLSVSCSCSISNRQVMSHHPMSLLCVPAPRACITLCCPCVYTSLTFPDSCIIAVCVCLPGNGPLGFKLSDSNRVVTTVATLSGRILPSFISNATIGRYSFVQVDYFAVHLDSHRKVERIILLVDDAIKTSCICWCLCR